MLFFYLNQSVIVTSHWLHLLWARFGYHPGQRTCRISWRCYEIVHRFSVVEIHCNSIFLLWPPEMTKICNSWHTTQYKQILACGSMVRILWKKMLSRCLPHRQQEHNIILAISLQDVGNNGSLQFLAFCYY